MVGDGDALMIDAGSTTSLFAVALAARNPHVTVVTNCLPVASALGVADRCRVILCPGDYVAREGGVFGTDALTFLRRFQANKAFIGAGGVSADGPHRRRLGRLRRQARDDRARQSRGACWPTAPSSMPCNSSGWPRCPTSTALFTEVAPPRRLAAALKQAQVIVTVAPR
jgi:hypothetical protein